ncbi:MAG: NAD(+)/NADH kinase [Peptococcaceae bacterium]|nr:NAD(+)/NADH kinase [Peptococcaceae bacterium]
MIQTLGLLFNQDKPQASQAAVQIQAWLQQQGVTVLSDQGQFSQADAVIVLGGDGTLLRAARFLSPLGIPLLGLNFGHLGFLTEVELAEWRSCFQKLLAGNYTVEARMMLQGTVLRSGIRDISALALNDVVVSRGDISRIITLDVTLSGQHLSSYPADGMIVSTPTGSTAYSLSAGGPIVSPLLQSMIITPICPHTLSARAMVVDPEEVLAIRFARGIDCVVTFDGQETIELSPGDAVQVERASFSTQLIKLSGRSFPELLQAKLKDSLHA